MKTQTLLTVCALVLVLVTSGCGATEVPAPTATAEPKPPTAEPTTAPSPTPAPTPTATPTAREYYEQGGTFFEDEDFEAAAEAFDHAVQLDTEFLEAYGMRGRSYGHLGRFDEAMDDFNRVLELDPEDPQAYHYRGVTYINQGDTEAALADFNRAIELDPDYAEAFYNRGLAYLSLYDVPTGRADLDRVAELEPDRDLSMEYGLAEMVLGDEDYFNGNMQAALGHYNKAIEIDPDGYAYSSRGDVYLALEKYDKAIEDYTLMIEIDPEFLDPFNNRCMAHAYQGNLEAALSDCNRAVELAGPAPVGCPECTFPYFHRANIYFDLGNMQAALDDYEQFLALYPADDGMTAFVSEQIGWLCGEEAGTTSVASGDSIALENAQSLCLLRVMSPEAGQQTAISAVAFDPTKNEVASLGWSAVVNIWDIESGEIARELTGHSTYGPALEYSQDGSRLVSGAYDYRVFTWDPVAGEEISHFQVNTMVNKARLSPDGSTLVVAGASSSTLTLYGAETGEVLAELQSGDAVNTAAAFSPDGEYVAAGDGDGQVKVFSLEDHSVVAELQGPVTPMADTLLGQIVGIGNAVFDVEFSPDGSLLAAGFGRGDVLVWNTSDWSAAVEGLVEFGRNGLFDMAFTRDGAAVIVVGDGHIYAVDVSTGDVLPMHEDHDTFWSISLSGDGSRFAVATDSGTVQIFGLR